MNMQFLENILTAYGPSGHEGRVSDMIAAALSGHVDSLTMPCDGSIPGVPNGRFVEGPAVVGKDGVRGEYADLPIELEDVMAQLSLCNLLYAEAAVTGSRSTLRTALEVDPALAGIDLLYTEGVLSDMMEGQKDKLKRFFD